MSRKRVAILISGRGSNMAALIEAAKDKTYPAEIVLVISNRPDAGGLLVAQANRIATEVVDHTAGKDRPYIRACATGRAGKEPASTSSVWRGSCGC
jgi:phosphoribosylglycinamide formyltransferase-1